MIPPKSTLFIYSVYLRSIISFWIAQFFCVKERKRENNVGIIEGKLKTNMKKQTKHIFNINNKFYTEKEIIKKLFDK